MNPKTQKLQEEKLSVHYKRQIGRGKDILKWAPFSQKLSTTIHKCNLINLKGICTSKKTMK